MIELVKGCLQTEIMVTSDEYKIKHLPQEAAQQRVAADALDRGDFDDRTRKSGFPVGTVVRSSARLNAVR